MAAEKPGFKNLGLLKEGPQDLRTYPILTAENCADGMWQLHIPRLGQFDKPVDAVVQKPDFVSVTALPGRQKRNKLAARRTCAAAVRERPQIHPQGTPVQKKKPREIDSSCRFSLVRDRWQI